MKKKGKEIPFPLISVHFLFLFFSPKPFTIVFQIIRRCLLCDDRSKMHRNNNNRIDESDCYCSCFLLFWVPIKMTFLCKNKQHKAIIKIKIIIINGFIVVLVLVLIYSFVLYCLWKKKKKLF